MREPSREAREAAEALIEQWTREVFAGQPVPGGIDGFLARALDDFARKWREEAEDARELRDFLFASGYRPCDIGACNCGSWHGGHAYARLREIYDALGGCNGTLPVPEIERLIDERDALRRRVAELQRRVDHCKCEDLIDHIRDHLPDYEHDDNVHGEPEPFNEIEKIEEAGREISALRRRVAELELAEEVNGDTQTRVEFAAMFLDERLERDVWKARAEAAERALADLEWSPRGELGTETCPWCENSRDIGHDDGCELGWHIHGAHSPNREARRGRGDG